MPLPNSPATPDAATIRNAARAPPNAPRRASTVSRAPDADVPPQSPSSPEPRARAPLAKLERVLDLDGADVADDGSDARLTSGIERRRR